MRVLCVVCMLYGGGVANSSNLAFFYGIFVYGFRQPLLYVVKVKISFKIYRFWKVLSFDDL